MTYPKSFQKINTQTHFDNEDLDLILRELKVDNDDPKRKLLRKDVKHFIEMAIIEKMERLSLDERYDEDDED